MRARNGALAGLMATCMCICLPVSACRDDPDAQAAPNSKSVENDTSGDAVVAPNEPAQPIDIVDPLDAAPYADLGIPPEADPSLAKLDMEGQKAAALEYSNEWQRSRGVFIARWDRADYAPLDSRDACKSLVARIPRTDSAGLEPLEADRLSEAVTAVAAMNSCAGYEEYLAFVTPRHARTPPDRMAKIREHVSREEGRSVSDDEAMRVAWEGYVLVDGVGPWRSLAVDHSEIATRRSQSPNISVREEILAIGTPSTAFTFGPSWHLYARKPADEVNENGDVLVATVRLLLRGRAPEEFGPMVLRFWWDSSSQLWLFDDEKMFLRNEGVVDLPWF